MTSTRSVEDVVDAADGWHLFGTECPKVEIVFSCQVIHGHCGQHLQSDSRAWRFYPLDCFTEQLVGLSVTQSITEKRRWRLSFTSFYPVMYRWLLTRIIRWHSTSPTYYVALVSLGNGNVASPRYTIRTTGTTFETSDWRGNTTTARGTCSSTTAITTVPMHYQDAQRRKTRTLEILIRPVHL